jgi:endonuclease/exonuclease/phosphatase family metal-dependent hydrolase
MNTIIKILSFNICFEQYHLLQRTIRLLETIKIADIICLQEVRQDVAENLIKILGNEYHISPYPHDVSYFTVTLVRRHLVQQLQQQNNNQQSQQQPPIIFKRTPYQNTVMERDLLTVELINGLVIGNTHLESLNSAPSRKAQSIEIVELLKRKSNVLVMGDFNMCSHVDFPNKRRSSSYPKLEQDDLVNTFIRNGKYVDVWDQFHPDDVKKPISDGITFNSSTQLWKKAKPGLVARYDRVMSRLLLVDDGGRFKISNIQLFENMPFSKTSEGYPLYTSDHYGVLFDVICTTNSNEQQQQQLTNSDVQEFIQGAHAAAANNNNVKRNKITGSSNSNTTNNNQQEVIDLVSSSSSDEDETENVNTMKKKKKDGDEML